MTSNLNLTVANDAKRSHCAVLLGRNAQFKWSERFINISVVLEIFFQNWLELAVMYFDDSHEDSVTLCESDEHSDAFKFYI